MNNTLTNKWYTHTTITPNLIISKDTIELAISNFYNEVMSKLNDNQYILVIFKIKTNDNLYRNISSMQIINKFDRDILIDSFIEYWNIKSANYIQFTISEIILNYKIIDDSFEVSSSKIHFPDKDTLKPNLLKCGSYNFPCTMDLFQWGSVEFINNDSEAIVYKSHSTASYFIKFNGNIMEVEYINKGKKLLDFTDELLDTNNLGTFKRIINNQTFYFKNGELHYKIKNFNFKTVKPLNKKGYLNNKIITMDLETFHLWR